MVTNFEQSEASGIPASAMSTGRKVLLPNESEMSNYHQYNTYSSVQNNEFQHNPQLQAMLSPALPDAGVNFSFSDGQSYARSTTPSDIFPYSMPTQCPGDQGRNPGFAGAAPAWSGDNGGYQPNFGTTVPNWGGGDSLPPPDVQTGAAPGTTVPNWGWQGSWPSDGQSWGGAGNAQSQSEGAYYGRYRRGGCNDNDNSLASDEAHLRDARQQDVQADQQLRNDRSQLTNAEQRERSDNRQLNSDTCAANNAERQEDQDRQKLRQDQQELAEAEKHKGGTLSQDGDGKPITYTTSGGDTVTIDHDTVTMKDKCGKEIEKDWGDPHTEKNGCNTNWTGTSRDVTLPDGTVVHMDANAANQPIQHTTITDGNREIEVDNKCNKVTEDNGDNCNHVQELRQKVAQDQKQVSSDEQQEQTARQAVSTDKRNISRDECDEQKARSAIQSDRAADQRADRSVQYWQDRVNQDKQHGMEDQGSGTLTQDGAGKPITYTTPGGNTVTIDKDTVTIKDRCGKEIEKDWGDPHTEKNGQNSNWTGTTRSVTLDDGTVVQMNACASDKPIQQTTITNGNSEIKVDNNTNTVTEARLSASDSDDQCEPGGPHRWWRPEPVTSEQPLYEQPYRQSLRDLITEINTARAAFSQAS